MSDQLRIELLGGCAIYHNNQVITSFKSRKTEALLAYLAHQERPFSRSELAQTFWSDSDPQQAAANLRKTLSELRQHVGDFLTITRDDIALNPSSNIWLDTAEFTRLFQQWQQTDSAATTQLAALEKAIALYRGDFLAGFYLRDSLAFDEWASLERERFFLAATHILRELVAHALHNGQYNQGIRHAAHWLALDPLQEAAHRQMMRLQARQGQRNAALAQYEQCRHILATELGVTPTTATELTIARIRAAGTRSMTTPPGLTSFIGRNCELAQLNQQLDNSETRLITITGMGGVGKTRLAQQLASIQQTEFREGVCFIPLADVTTNNLLTTINTYLGVPSNGRLTPHQQMLDYLQAKELLLILDNFEHLLDMSPMLAKVLHVAPTVKLIVTSRVRLNLAEEWVFDLGGLPLPDPDNQQPLDTYAAVQLFQERTVQVCPTFAITPVNEADIRHICHLVEGLPLGLELAAAAMRAFTPAQIAAHIRQNLDFLDTRARWLPPRQRSMRAVFDYSWNLLTPPEQSALMHLAVFRGGFTAVAAAAIAPPANLDEFTQKSLLHQDENGRFHIHELIRQYACEKLQQSDRAAATQEKHANYCATRLANLLPLLRSIRQKEALDTIQHELENIQAAWVWATQQSDIALLDQMLEPLYWFYHVNGRYQDAFTQFQPTAAALAQQTTTAAQTTWARLCIRQAIFAYGLADYDEAIQQLDVIEPIVVAHNMDTEQAMILRQRGRLAQARSQYAAAIPFYEQSMARFQVLGDTYRVSTVLLDLGNAYCHLNQPDQAETLLQQTLALQIANDDLNGRAKTLNSLAAIAQERGDYSGAQAQYEQSLTLRRQIGDKIGIANLLNNLGNLACDLRKWEEGVRYYQESLVIKREIGAPLSIAISLLNLGTAYQELGAHDNAAELYQESLTISQQIDDQIGIVFSLSNLAELAWLQKDYTLSRTRWQQALTLAYQLNASDRIFYSLFGLARLWRETSQETAVLATANDILHGLLAEPTCIAALQDKIRQIISQAEPEVQQWQPTRSLLDIATSLVKIPEKALLLDL
ncbi:MAG: tetratricopeptide repeat protein [Anaerolineales bacterium]|nr:tetratricopeptide repeat protein [Anaerolineales bacterium]